MIVSRIIIISCRLSPTPRWLPNLCNMERRATHSLSADSRRCPPSRMLSSLPTSIPSPTTIICDGAIPRANGGMNRYIRKG